VDQMWAAANRLGFAGGRILEPGMGVGNFFARIPDQLLHESELFGVEKNPLSGALASMLYPDAKILVQPFEDTRLPNNSFDMVIGNAGPPAHRARLPKPLRDEAQRVRTAPRGDRQGTARQDGRGRGTCRC